MNGYITDDYIESLDADCTPISTGFVTTFYVSWKPSDGVVLNEKGLRGRAC